MPAMLQIWDGKLSLEVAKDIHMTAPCFRKRVHRYNEYGIAGLIDTWHSNRKSYFSQEQKETVIEAWQKPPSECGFSKSNRTMPLQKSENSYVWHSKPIDGKVRFKTSGAANLDSFKAFLLYEENFAF